MNVDDDPIGAMVAKRIREALEPLERRIDELERLLDSREEYEIEQ